ncbi:MULTISPECIES: hypothetical protein [unclassified Streptomyces]|uniref:hypothetical protein n=1 Tax=unclassified Streptomyces TaxID=2593676 RepID=UPI003D8AEB22
MAAPTTVYTTAELAAVLANPHCPPVLRSNWDRLTTTAANHADAVRRYADPSWHVGDDAEDVDYWFAQNVAALRQLDGTLTHFAALLPALIAGADPYAFIAV